MKKGSGVAKGERARTGQSCGPAGLRAEDGLPAGSLFALGEQLQGNGLEQRALGQYRGKITQFFLEEGVGGVGSYMARPR
ncbi:hypothetical protein AWV79_10870 [Cupriavidus sp. UYMMa02A]|nr:hypothetical protein AWV79_10870 [Cupriavidus sp. UYMMa02A]